MRYLAARNSKHSKPIRLVSMREMYDCFTCVAAMLLGIEYEEVESAFGGNLDPIRGETEESQRLQSGFGTLLQRYQRGALDRSAVPPITEGRRYWVGIKINDPSNSLSKQMTHSIVVDEFGRVFDPNPQCGEFGSLKEWSAAMTLPHEIEFAVELFEYSL